jgi:hypothetical protein
MFNAKTLIIDLSISILVRDYEHIKMTNRFFIHKSNRYRMPHFFEVISQEISKKVNLKYWGGWNTI